MGNPWRARKIRGKVGFLALDEPQEINYGGRLLYPPRCLDAWAETAG